MTFGGTFTLLTVLLTLIASALLLQGVVQNDFVQEFVRSRAFPDNYRHLLTTLSQQTTSLPQAAIEACEQVVTQDTDRRLNGHYLIPLLLRLYRQGRRRPGGRCCPGPTNRRS